MVKGLNELLILGGILVGSYFLFGRESTTSKGFPTIQREKVKEFTLEELNQIQTNQETIQSFKKRNEFFKDEFVKQEQQKLAKKFNS